MATQSVLEKERDIKGIPIRQFIDLILKQEKTRKENEGELEDYPIHLPGIGLHHIKAK